MSKHAEPHRAAMKAKAARLVRTDPKGKVDASGYTPPDALNADVQTGMRPVSPRAFKAGGKAMAHHGGRKPRASGGEIATALVNRNDKAANESRAGEKHDGGLNKGGRACRARGGKVGKGKTNINIVIATGAKHPDGAPAPAGGPVPMAPPMRPPVPPMPMGAAPAPMGGPPGLPPGMAPPMGRKRGGRTEYHAGAGSGEGRLEKVEAYGGKA